MTNNPIERLRNKLSPFLNLVNLLTLDQVKIQCQNETFKSLFEKEIATCANISKEIHKHLDDADEIIASTGFKTKGLDYTDLREKLDTFLNSQTKENLEEWLDENRVRGHLLAPSIPSLSSDIGYYIRVDGTAIPEDLFPDEYLKIREAYNSFLKKLRDYAPRDSK